MGESELNNACPGCSRPPQPSPSLVWLGEYILFSFYGLYKYIYIFLKCDYLRMCSLLKGRVGKGIGEDIDRLCQLMLGVLCIVTTRQTNKHNAFQHRVNGNNISLILLYTTEHAVAFPLLSRTWE